MYVTAPIETEKHWNPKNKKIIPEHFPESTFSNDIITNEQNFQIFYL